MIGPCNAMTQGRKDPRRGAYRSRDEIDMRDAVDRWGRAKWPAARVVHELVMDRGTVRADMAFIGPDHFAAVEIKSAHDDADRLVNQAAMFRLASPEVWLVVDQLHQRNAQLIRYLLPSIGVAVAEREGKFGGGPFVIREVEPVPTQPFVVLPEAMLSLLWVAELHAEAVAAGLWPAKKVGSHAKLVAALMKLPTDQRCAAVCRQLRARDALWRADPPVTAEPA